MNFFVALRASVTQRLSSFLFFWVLTIVGFQPAHIYTVVAIHLFIAFLHHTEFIYKFPRPIEWLFTTPSHHRVHHGVNLQYLDKNYGEFLIIWDRMFGTFEEEQEPVAYGILEHPEFVEPDPHQFSFLYRALEDGRRGTVLVGQGPHLVYACRMGSARTADERKPDINRGNQVKFRLRCSLTHGFIWSSRLVLGIALMIGVISNTYGWTTGEKWFGAALLWWQIINWSGILEAKSWTWISESLRNLATPAAVIAMSEIYQPSALMFAVIAVSLFAFSDGVVLPVRQSATCDGMGRPAL
ncbi:MAG: sterol desaturase family protein [Acidobacteria bacterium]|nr:sterol desaturase family protein [Acidobacteriota bacterium]